MIAGTVTRLDTTGREYRRERPRADSEGPHRPIRIGFVNNMPDAAFEDTFQQFAALIGSSTSRLPADISCYYIPTVPRSAAVLETASVPYEDVECLYDSPPDALVVTGTEPRCAELSDEPYWDALAGLLRWAESVVPSTLLSCLASHAAVLALDGIRRSRLPSKQSGVFNHVVDRVDPLAHGLGSKVAFPHSRLNEIPVSELRAHQYRLVVSSDRTGWTVAARERRGRLLVLLQGHPEYKATTLLKEYRRDVRRFLDGFTAVHPEQPFGYLDRTGVKLLKAFRERCESSAPPSAEDFPYEAAVEHIRASWDNSSRQLLLNWMADAQERMALVAT